MALWDQIKSTFKSNPDVPDDEKLTASMWNQHIEDGHFAADELNFGDDGSGNPVITDPQNSDEIVMRYVRGTGWVPVGGLKLATPLDADNNEIDNASDVDTDSLSGGVSGGTTVSNILGDGLENVSNTLQAALGDGLGFTGGDITASLGDGLDFASGNIQLLDSIWDAANSELTADVNNTNTTTETLEADGIVVGDDIRYAGYYDGSDPDARLDAALANASSGDKIILEGAASYTQTRTISKQIHIEGRTSGKTSVSNITADWTFNDPVTLEHVRLINSTVTLNSSSFVFDVYVGDFENGSIMVDASRCRLISSRQTDITLTSNSSACVVDDVVSGSVTDNGSNNVVGDIS